jgi:hypothetical protein
MAFAAYLFVCSLPFQRVYADRLEMQLRTHSLIAVSSRTGNQTPLTSLLTETYSPTWIQICRVDGLILEEIPLCAQTSMPRNSWGRGRCADREIGTYDLLQTDHHKKDGYFRGFP